MALNAAQRRSVSATFAHVSKLLEDVERLTRAEQNGFDRERADLTPSEAQHLRALAGEVRTGMLDALEDLGIPLRERDGSARWNAQTLLLYAGIALSELEGKSLRAYGALAKEDAERVTAVVHELRRIVEGGREFLRGAAGVVPPGKDHGTP